MRETRSTVVNGTDIGATTSTTGLTVRCVLDENLYPAGIKVSDEELARLNIIRNEFHGDRNYTITPSHKN